MKIQQIKIEKIKPYDKNPRNNQSAVDKVAKSLEEFGWQQPIVLDKNYVIVAGHTRYLAAQKNGYETVPCTIADNLTDKQIRAYRIADNKTSDFSIWDNKLLLEELEGLDDIFTGFDLPDFEELSVLDENNNSVIEDTECGVTYECVLRSENKEKIERIKQIWDEMSENEE